jgi:hypothetical protein
MSITTAVKAVTRHGVVILPILAMVFLTASSPQCARTSDRALNPLSSVASAEFGNCVSGCAHDAADARRIELEDFVAKMKDCDTPECKQAASAEHVANLQAIQYAFKICMAICHDQGAATGGN